MARVLLLLVPLLLREAVEVVAMRPIAFQRVLIATSSASAAECAAAWDLLAIRRSSMQEMAEAGKELCIRIAMMLSKMG